jgi:hypothetical protein
MGCDAHRCGKLRHRSGARSPSWAGPPVAMPSAMPQAHPLHRADEQRRGLRRATSVRGPSLRHLLRRFPLAFQTDNLGFALATIAPVDEAADGARHRPFADSPPTPDHPDGHRLGRTPIEDDGVAQTPQQGLALGATARVLWPQRGERWAQRAAGLAEVRGDVSALLSVLGTAREPRVRLPRLLYGVSGRLPARLQCRRHHAGGRVDRLGALARLIGRMLKPLAGGGLRPVDGDLLLAALLAGVRIEVELRRGQGCQEGAHHLLVHRVGAQALTHRGLRLPAQRVTAILRAACIRDHHFVPTAAARDHPLEQGRPLAWDPPALVLLLGGLGVIDTRLHACNRLPRHGGRVTVGHAHLPRGSGRWTLLRAPTARGHLARRFAIRQGARIRRMTPERQHCRHGGSAPHRGAVAMATRQAQPLSAQQTHPLRGGAALQKRLADQGHGMRHGLVGGCDHDPIVVAQQTGRSGQGQGAALRLLRHARQQTAPQGVELALAHDPLPASHQTALGGGGIVDAIAVRHPALLRGTQSQQRVPSGAVARHAGARRAEPDADLPQGDFGQERLRAVAPLGALGRPSPVGLDDREALRGPAQGVGLLPHGVLALVTLGMGEHLGPGGVPHGDDGFSTEMMRVHNWRR